MALAMSRPFKHPRTGIYWLRKRVPAALVQAVGSREISRSLDTRDPAVAKQRHVTVLAELEAQWANLARNRLTITEREAHVLADDVYAFWLRAHRDNPSHQLLWRTDFFSGLWTAPYLPEIEPSGSEPGVRPIENTILRSMRAFCFQQADHGLELHGVANDHWNRITLAKAIGAALQRASLALEQQAFGIFDRLDEPAPPDHARLLNSASSEASNHVAPPPASARQSLPNSSEETGLSALFDGWRKEAEASGLKPSTLESYRNSFASFKAFLGHDDLSRVSQADVLRFKDHRLTTPSRRTGRIPSAKTVKDSDLSALKAIFGWAVVNLKISSNPAAGVTIRIAKRPKLRSKGFTDDEALAILSATLNLQAGNAVPKTVAAKRWVPWLCAFTGARVGEIAQLRKQDVTYRDGMWVVRITPEAGTVKTNEAREVPLHAQIVETGFPDFASDAPPGPLFLTPSATGDVLGPLQGLKNRLAEFARSVVSDPNVAPNHGWRHRFKTVGMEAGIPPRILDAIQGQAARTVADTYGDVTLRTINKQLQSFRATLSIEPCYLRYHQSQCGACRSELLVAISRRHCRLVTDFRRRVDRRSPRAVKPGLLVIIDKIGLRLGVTDSMSVGTGIASSMSQRSEWMSDKAIKKDGHQEISETQNFDIDVESLQSRACDDAISLLRECRESRKRFRASVRECNWRFLVSIYAGALALKSDEVAFSQFASDPFFRRRKYALKQEDALRLSMLYCLSAGDTGPRYKRACDWSGRLQEHFERNDAPKDVFAEIRDAGRLPKRRVKTPKDDVGPARQKPAIKKKSISLSMESDLLIQARDRLKPVLSMDIGTKFSLLCRRIEDGEGGFHQFKLIAVNKAEQDET